MARGLLRVYLGAAPGVGKTFDMLSEGRRRAQRGTDVVVGLVETHGRPHTAELLEGLEVVPRHELTYRGATFTEMDLDAVLARRPRVALVDELAHTNVPGSRNAKRWQDVEELVAAGIDVVSTVNIQHLESLGDVVASITGVIQHETIPDDVVRRADQIELVDMTPEALRRRLAHGNVYAAEKVDAALSNYFRVGNLTALRELALLWMADRVDDALEKYRADEGIDASWPARERVVVALTGGPEGETLLRRGARIAGRGAGGELLAVHVARSDGLASTRPGALERQRVLTESLGGTFHTVVGEDVAEAILEFARGVNAAMIVVGVSRRPRWQLSVREGVGERVVRKSGAIDVHVVTHEHARQGTLLRRAEVLGRARLAAGWVLAVVGTITLTAVLVAFRESHELPTDLMLFLAFTVAVALLGGLWPAVTTAVFGSLLLNWWLTPPYNSLTITDPENTLALAIFVLVAVGVASVVDLAARRTLQAARSSAEADTLSALAGSVLRDENTVVPLLDRMRERFGMDSVTLLERDGNRTWRHIAHAGDRPCQKPEDGTSEVTVSDTLALALRGPVLDASDRRVLEAFAAQTAVMLDRQRLRRRAEEARRLGEGEAIRTALLAAVSHDLRTPLAAIKAGVTSLRQDDVEWSPADEAELLATVGEATDTLERLIDNLLDLSRLQTRTVHPVLHPASLDEIIPRALAGVPAHAVVLDLPESLPLLVTDAGLLERAVANIVENAVRYSAPGSEVTVSAALVPGAADDVEIRVVDRGPGVPEEHKATMFLPFQRLGDSRPARDDGASAGGLGLGLAVARGFTDALGGALTADDTPGGGLTMVLRLPVTPVPATPADPPAGAPDRVQETA